MPPLIFTNDTIGNMRLVLDTHVAHGGDNHGKWLANGVPASAIPSACVYHRLQLENAAAIGQFPPHNAAHHDIITNTALFPMCRACTITAIVDQGGQVLAGIDCCMCDWRALMTSMSQGCAYCELDRIHNAKASHYEMRRHRSTNPWVAGEESKELRCSCGAAIEGPEEVRKCVGCDRIVSTPFHNFAGEEVTFRVASLAVESRKAPGSLYDPAAGDLMLVDQNGIAESGQMPPASNGAEGREVPMNDPDGMELPSPAGQSDETLSTSTDDSQADNDVADILPERPSATESTAPSPPHSKDVPEIIITSASPPPTPPPQPMFTPEQATSLGKLQLVIPQVPSSAHFDPQTRLHDLLVANRMTTITLSAMREVMTICGYDQDDIKMILLVGGLASKIWMNQNEARVAEVLWRLRDKGLVAQACDE